MKEVKKDVTEAIRVGINLLARREHSEMELRRKLQTRGFEISIIDETLQLLITKKYLSNARFIENYIQARRNKGYGPIRVQIELAARGLTALEIEPYLKMHDEAWQDIALQTWKKKFKNIMPRDFKERALQMRFLQYRGFTSDQIDFILQSDIEHA